MREFILASASPRRREILKRQGYNFVIEPSGVEEKKDLSLSKEELAVSLAAQKAEAVFEKERRPVLGADTIVVFDGEILGKPKDVAENLKFLNALSGKEHVVITGYCFISEKGEIKGFDSAKVKFRELSESEKTAYAESGLGLDKAGGYGIQDGFGLVESVEGDYDTVVGLPMKKIADILEKNL